MNAPLKPAKPNPVCEEFNNAMIAVLANFQDRLAPMEMLAVASHFVGVLIAAQDQRKVTREMAIQLVQANIEAGNAAAIEDFLNQKGGHA